MSVTQTQYLYYWGCLCYNLLQVKLWPVHTCVEFLLERGRIYTFVQCNKRVHVHVNSIAPVLLSLLMLFFQAEGLRNEIQELRMVRAGFQTLVLPEGLPPTSSDVIIHKHLLNVLIQLHKKGDRTWGQALEVLEKFQKKLSVIIHQVSNTMQCVYVHVHIHAQVKYSVHTCIHVLQIQPYVYMYVCTCMYMYIV